MEESVEQRHNGLFSGISVASVLATALAAVTSFALQSRIGFAGSIIGTALAAAASAIATRVYENMLVSSAERLRAATPTGPRAGGTAHPAAAHGLASGGAPGQKGARTVQRQTRAHATPRSHATEHMRQVAAAHHARDLQARVILFAATAAVVLALAVAGAIVLTTRGEGIQTPVFFAAPVGVTQTTDESSEGGQGQADGGGDAQQTEGEPTAGDGTETGEGAPSDEGTSPDGTSPDSDAGTNAPPAMDAPVDQAPAPDDTTGGTETTAPGESTAPGAGQPARPTSGAL